MPEEKFSTEINKLVGYIKENMKDKDDWVVVKYRDVPKITGISTYYVRKIFELLKDHPNIVFEVDKDAKTYKKPLKFKYTDEEEKIESVITEKSFYYLDQQEIDYIQNKLQINDYKKLFKILNMVNYIASVGAKEKFVPLTISEIADILVETKKLVKSNMELLEKHQILIDKNGYVRLILNSSDLHYVKEEMLNLDLESATPSKKTLSVDREGLVEKLLKEKGLADEDAETVSNESNNSGSLLENLNNFKDAIFKMQEDFRSYLEKELDRVSESDKKDQEMNEGYETLMKLMDENQRLTDENEKLKRENNQLVNSLNKSQRYRDVFIKNAEQRLEILLAEVIGIVSNYSQIPGWQKDQAANARLQKNILNAVTSAVDDMLSIDTDD